jgi:predicted PurR-regulated permease PerM
VEKHLSLPALCPRLITITLLVLVIATTPITSHEATGEQLATANSSVDSAFSSVYYAEQNGGDVSALVEKLNTAILLIQKAVAENATDPNAATADLSNATAIAQTVSLDSSSVSTSGSLAHQFRFYGSLGTVAATVGLSVLAYLKGDRVYRRLWLYVYRNHVVKKNDE